MSLEGENQTSMQFHQAMSLVLERYTLFTLQSGLLSGITSRVKRFKITILIFHIFNLIENNVALNIIHTINQIQGTRALIKDRKVLNRFICCIMFQFSL